MKGRGRVLLALAIGLLLVAVTAVSVGAQAQNQQGWACPFGDAGAGPLGMGRGAMMGVGGFGMWGADGALAELGLTQEEIVAGRQAGKSLAEMADEQGVAREDLIAAIVAEHQARIAELVTAGRLTQEQADAMSANFEAMATAMVDRAGVGPMGFGHGGMMGPRYNQNGSQDGTAVPGFNRGPGRMAPYWQNQDGTQTAPQQQRGPGMMGRFGSRA